MSQALAQPVRDGRVEAELLARDTALIAGQTATVGLRLKMDGGWHTYWQNPGDAGLATTLTWDLPAGYVAHEIDWPSPDYFEVSGLASHGYEGEILLPVRIDVPADAGGGGQDEGEGGEEKAVTLRVTADWLVCRELCETGMAELSLTLPVGDASSAKSGINPAYRRWFEWAAQRQPQPLAEGAGSAYRGDDVIGLQLKTDPLSIEAVSDMTLRFFPAQSGLIEMSAEQRMLSDPDGGRRLTLVPAIGSASVERLRGVVVGQSKDRRVAYQIDLPIRDVADDGRVD